MKKILPFQKNTVYHTVFSEKRPCETDTCKFHAYCVSRAPVSKMITFQAACFS